MFFLTSCLLSQSMERTLARFGLVVTDSEKLFNVDFNAKSHRGGVVQARPEEFAMVERYLRSKGLHVVYTDTFTLVDEVPRFADDVTKAVVVALDIGINLPHDRTNEDVLKGQSLLHGDRLLNLFLALDAFGICKLGRWGNGGVTVEYFLSAPDGPNHVIVLTVNTEVDLVLEWANTNGAEGSYLKLCE